MAENSFIGRMAELVTQHRLNPEPGAEAPGNKDCEGEISMSDDARSVESVARAIADADDEDYMENMQMYDRRAKAAIAAITLFQPLDERSIVNAALSWVREEPGSRGALQDACFELLRRENEQ